MQLANIDADSKVINVYVNKGADLSKQKLEFTLPQGATIKVNTPITGDTESTYDFSEEPHSRKFTVTSEDGQWQPVYTVNVILAELPTLFKFEELLTTSSEYDTFYEFTPATSQEISKVLQWSSGNPGFKLTGMANSRIDYPTVQVANGFKGKAVKLETRNTGDFGAMVKMYIAAGNLFIGTFEVENALTNPRKATNFGFQFYKHPIALKGYYKFKAGEVYSVEGQPQTGKRGPLPGSSLRSFLRSHRRWKERSPLLLPPLLSGPPSPAHMYQMRLLPVSHRQEPVPLSSDPGRSQRNRPEPVLHILKFPCFPPKFVRFRQHQFFTDTAGPV